MPARPVDPSRRIRISAMLEPALTWIRSLKDPFRNANAAAQWIDALPTTDAMAPAEGGAGARREIPRRPPRRRLRPGRGAAADRREARARPRAARAAVRDELPEEHRRRDAAVARRLRSGQGLCGGLRRRASGGLPALRPQALAGVAAVDPGPPRPLQGHRRQVPAVPLRHAGSRRSGANFTSSTNSRGRAAGSATSSRTAPACSRGRACASSRNT